MAGDNRLIVTTIQKLNRAIKSQRHEAAMESLKDNALYLSLMNATVPNLAKPIKISSNSLPKPKCLALPGLPSLPITLLATNTVNALPKTYSRNVCINM
jgi:type I site-specific restriction-modification system R (restriction) subunit